ncbi:hypothetical protein GDO81_024521 [Engystomops pustulosus]|uniref:Uncharacterized protein n=1 Tax=Engystomops pustulosus TaxID=76066 RepID=A0AAV6YTX0_ENGPU|nr:hypothetical protein GDO81_024521 [Engystomops pustulosus]
MKMSAHTIKITPFYTTPFHFLKPDIHMNAQTQRMHVLSFGAHGESRKTVSTKKSCKRVFLQFNLICIFFPQLSSTRHGKLNTFTRK